MNKNILQALTILIFFVLFSSGAFAITDADLLEWFKLDETTGNVTGAFAGSSCSVTDVTQGVTGFIDKAIDGEGDSGDYIDCGDGIFDRSTAMSWSFWYNPSATPVGSRTFISRLAGAGVKQYNFEHRSDGKMRFSMGFSGGDVFAETDTAIPNNEWSHFVGTWDGTTGANAVKIYWNADLNAQASPSGTKETTTNNTYLTGNPSVGSQEIEGKLDEVGFFSVALSQSDINDLYNNGLGLTYPFESIDANFTYTIDKQNQEIDFNDLSIDLGTDVNTWSWLINGTEESTDQNFTYPTTPFTDLNTCIIAGNGTASDSYCQQFNTGNFFGEGQFNFYDENSETELAGVSYSISPSINGLSSGTLTDNNLDLNFQGITSQDYTFSFSKTNYRTTQFKLSLNQFSELDYNVAMLLNTDSTQVDFQVYNESGSFASNKQFFAYDYGINMYLGTKTTDSLGRMNFYLNQTKSDYNFFSTDFNFGTTIWTINKPKSATTLNDITENWQYSITGASYSSGYNIPNGITKLLLQNTVNPYYIKISDINGVYAETTFGLQSITSEETKELIPYLYPFGSASLKLIKLIDFATNQPIATATELDLFLYTDSNGLIQIGTFINDSTGTYNIYMDANELYKLNIGNDSFELRPTLDIYYLYLTSNIGLDINGTYNDVNTSGLTDFNLPTIFLEVREYMFGCSQAETNCWSSAIFSLIAIVFLTVIFSVLSGNLPIVQSIITGFLLIVFTTIGFVPLWLFGIGIVILIAWGVFG